MRQMNETAMRPLSWQASAEQPLIIKHGWDAPSPQWVRDHLPEMERLGLDGVVLTLGDMSDKLNSQTAVTYDEIRQMLAPLAGMNSSSLTHNFVIVRAGEANVFDDDTVALQNFANLARAAREVGLEGVMYDGEDYKGSRWTWPDATPGRTLAVAQDQSRLRGRQMAAAMIKEWDGINMISLYGPWVSEPKTGAALGAGIPYIDVASANLLMGSWVVGMIEATVGTRATVVDGGEIYSLRSSGQFERAFEWMKNGFAAASALVPDSVKKGYSTKVGVAFGIYDEPVAGADMDVNLWRDAIVQAMRRTDRYVWLYTEKYDWWGTGWPTERVPQAWVDATSAAKAAGLKARSSR
jgi:hypothetical protein